MTEVPEVTAVAPLPADRLREAAGVVRELSAAARSEDWGDRPWHVEQCSDVHLGECACIVAQGEHLDFEQAQVPPIRYVADAETPELATWIALMNPAVGEALAAWLESVADRLEETTHPGWQAVVVDPHALALADAILAAVAR